jgi:hypothetical protein
MNESKVMLHLKVNSLPVVDERRVGLERGPALRTEKTLRQKMLSRIKPGLPDGIFPNKNTNLGKF